MQYSASIRVAVIFDEPIDPVEIAAFFVGGERENQIAVGLVVLFLHANELGDEDGVAFLHVVGAATVEVAVLFDELKRIGGPVFAAGFDDVEMSDEEDRFALAGAMDARDKIFLAVVGAGDDDVVAGEAGSRRRAAMASAAVVTLPTESVVLISMSCWKISRASRSERFAQRRLRRKKN